MINGILINEKSARAIRAEDKLETWYTLLNCSCINIVSRKIGGHYYDIICDGEGLLKENPFLRAMARNQREILTGNLFICNVNEGGELTSLDSDDVRIIKRDIVYHNGKPILIYDI